MAVDAPRATAYAEHSSAFSAFYRCNWRFHGQCDRRGCNYASRFRRLNHASTCELCVRPDLGLGLMISGMTQPAKVLGFLDIFGRWDPTLAFVMAGALAVSSVGYALARRQTRPSIAAQHFWPKRTERQPAAGAVAEATKALDQ